MVQCLFQIRPNVLNVFNAHGKAQKPHPDAEGGFHIVRHAAVRLGIAVVHQTFHAAEAGCKLEQFEVFDDAGGGLAAVVFKVNR